MKLRCIGMMTAKTRWEKIATAAPLANGGDDERNALKVQVSLRRLIGALSCSATAPPPELSIAERESVSFSNRVKSYRNAVSNRFNHANRQQSTENKIQKASGPLQIV